MILLLWLAGLLAVLWVLGFFAHIGGLFIHLLIALAVLLLLVWAFTGRSV